MWVFTMLQWADRQHSHWICQLVREACSRSLPSPESMWHSLALRGTSIFHQALLQGLAL